MPTPVCIIVLYIIIIINIIIIIIIVIMAPRPLPQWNVETLCVYRPLRADECLPVLTHRLVTDGSQTDRDDRDESSHRRRKDSHKKKDGKVGCVVYSQSIEENS